MTDKEKIKAEIERLKAEQLTIFSKGEDEDSYSDALIHIGAYNQLLSFIDSLSEESINKDLEEAAKEFASDPSPLLESLKYNCFKEGVRWNEERMMKNSVNAGIYRDGENRTLHAITVPIDNVEFGERVKVIVIKDLHKVLEE